ncbi:hypothetical protein DSL72_004904 [Monilinia vaccinii-corymbosi]|uniref:alpha,alpha-trehalase n=1 Tax=Monilinia vaccinii-corymbosi TaxID=61207 RepID=A0A8A3P5J1_9HELO|nr:hypothetical protein DSL72_004904 [Monilinia vaccinii-corymbosi]
MKCSQLLALGLAVASPPMQVVHGADVNPASQFKSKTIPDGTMPPMKDFTVFAEDRLSRWNDENQTLNTDILIPGDFRARMHLSNGYFGLAVASLGPFYEADLNQTHRDGKQPTEGWPEFNPRQTFAGVAGFFDRQANTTETNYPELLLHGDESVISGIPHFSDIHVTISGQVLSPTVDSATISNFTSSMNFRDATKHWSFTWTPDLNRSSCFRMDYMMFISRERVNVAATQLIITPLNGARENIIITDILDGRSAVRSFLSEKGAYGDTESIYVSNHPNGLQDISAWTVSTANLFDGRTNYMSPRAIVYPNDNSMTIGQQWNLELKPGQPSTFHKFVGVASTDKFPDAKLTATQASRNAARDGWDILLAEHTAIWNRDMQRNNIHSYRDPSTGRLPANDTMAEIQQIAAVVNSYMLLQAHLEENGTNINDNGVSVGGLTADPYAGLYFWDMDIWMFPGLCMNYPEHAHQIVKYRLKMISQARVNAQEAYVQEKYKFDNNSVLYSWTSGRYGNATGTGPVLDYEYHINTDVAKMMLDYRKITGDEDYFRQELWPAVKSVGHTIEGLLQKDVQGKWNIKNMTDPDEWTNNIDNGAFTQASFLQIMNSIISIKRQYNESVPFTWLDIAQNIAIPVSSSGITLEYENMPPNINVKQADVTLLLHPLSLPESSNPINYTLERKQNDLQYYTQKQSLHGPAMTFAINTIATLRYGSSGCSASTYNKMAVVPNLRAPWFIMSEQTSDDPNANGGYPPAFPFLTGHGGAMQIPLFGYLGLDISQDFLTIQPTLPGPLKYLRLPNFKFEGHTFTASMNTTHTNITFIHASPFASQNTTSVPLFQNLPASRRPQVEYTLSLNHTLTLKNDMYWEDLTTPNDLLQCLPIIGSHATELNRWPESVNDGDVGTSWQPETAEESSIAIDTGSVKGERVKAINVVWGQRIPTSALVVISNSTSASHSSADGHVFPLPLPALEIPVPGEIKIHGVNSSSDVVSSDEYPDGDGEGDSGDDDVKLEEGYKTTYILTDDEVVYMGDIAVLQIAGCIGTSCGISGDEAGATVQAWEIIREA